MSKDVIICVGTIEGPTFEKCFNIVNSLFKDHEKVLKISVIKNKKPRSEWLNEMMKQSIESGAKWCLQVDEDMYLYKDALDKLYSFATTSNKKVLNASCLLQDLFLSSKIGSLKLWNVDAFKFSQFKDVLGSDRQFARDLEKFGFTNIAMDSVLADHDSAPTPEIAYNKYYEYTTKMYKFNSEEEAKRFNITLKNKYLKNNSNINKLSYLGSLKALKTQESNKEKVSIIISNYNKGHLLLRSVKSALNQTYKNIEIIIVDDNSNDNLLNILKDENDPRIIVYKTSVNYGTYACRNFGIYISTGGYLTFLDSDDFIDFDHIEKKVKYINEKNVKAVCTKYIRIDENNKKVGNEKLCEASILFRKSLIKTIGYYHMVRFGADTEFRKRIELVFKEKSIFLLNDVSYKAHYSSNTLTLDLKTGHKSEARKKYVNEFLRNLHEKKKIVYNFEDPMSFLDLNNKSLVFGFSMQNFKKIR
jgi:glycosyltransferase involved in cell wall biosynthesis